MPQEVVMDADMVVEGISEGKILQFLLNFCSLNLSIYPVRFEKII